MEALSGPGLIRVGVMAVARTDACAVVSTCRREESVTTGRRWRRPRKRRSAVVPRRGPDGFRPCARAAGGPAAHGRARTARRSGTSIASRLRSLGEATPGERAPIPTLAQQNVAKQQVAVPWGIGDARRMDGVAIGALAIPRADTTSRGRRRRAREGGYEWGVERRVEALEGGSAGDEGDILLNGGEIIETSLTSNPRHRNKSFES